MITAVTGANGHIGANLVRALLKEKRQVRALVHVNRRAIEGLDIEVLPGNVENPSSLYHAFSGAEVVYHLAGLVSLSQNDWPAVEKTNVIGTRNVVEACLKCGVRRLVHFSSIHAVVQEPLDIPVDELRPLADTDDYPPYGRSKAAGEREVRQGIEQGLDAVIIRPTAVIGPHDYQLSLLGKALLTLAQGKLPALVEGGFNWVDARDIAEGALRAEEKAPLGAKYLLSGQWATVQDLARLTSELSGAPVPRFVLPAWLAQRSAPVMTAFSQLTRNRSFNTAVSFRTLLNCNQNISHERATRELNYHPRSLRQTLSDTIKWFQQAGLLDLTQNEK